MAFKTADPRRGVVCRFHAEVGCACLANAPARAQIFLRAGQMAALDKLRTDLLNASAVTLQRHARGFVLRRRYARVRRAVVTLQARLDFRD